MVAVALAATLASIAQAGVWDEPAFSASAESLLALAAESPLDTEEGAVVLYREEEYVVDEQGRIESRQHFIYRIDSAAAAQALSFVSVTWRPWHQERPEVRARVITKDATVHQLDLADLGEYSADQGGPDLFGDAKALRGPLPAVASGSIIEEEFVIRDTSPFFDGGVATLVSFELPLPVHRTRLIIDAPASNRPRYVARLLPQLRVKTADLDGRNRMVFDHGPLPAWDGPELLLPSDVPPVPFIGFTTGSSWRAVASR